MKQLMIFGIVAALATMAVADPTELAELQKILQATRGSWEAGETSVSSMSPIEQEQLLGLLPGVADLQRLPEETLGGEEARGSFEAKHTPIKDQGQCGSCYSFGASASYEGFKLISGKTTDLSEQWFMMKAKAIGPYGGCSGWYLDSSMNLLKDHGVANESDCKYLAREQACTAGQAVNKIGAWSRTSSKSGIQSALQQYGPVYVGFAVFQDFSYYNSGYYKYTSGAKRGYHAVAVVAYDDNGFKVKNSWGTGWGERGYFKIAYDQMSNAVEFGTCFGGSYYITR